jgi:hypothetical protein
MASDREARVTEPAFSRVTGAVRIVDSTIALPKFFSNGRTDDTAVDRRGKGITESGSADVGSDPPAVVMPASAATHRLIVSAARH